LGSRGFKNVVETEFVEEDVHFPLPPDLEDDRVVQLKAPF